MTPSDEQPAIDPIFGDMFGPQQEAVSREFMAIMMRLPAVLTQQFEGGDGVVEVPPEQVMEILRNAVLKLMHFVPQMAGALDLARMRITKLEEQIAELEAR